MNKKGAIGLTIVFAVFYFIVGMTAYQLIKPDITVARTSMSCTSPDTNGDMIICLILDSIVPYFIIVILSTTGGIITDQAMK